MLRKILIYMVSAILLLSVGSTCLGAEEQNMVEQINNAGYIRELKELVDLDQTQIFFSDEVFAYLIGRDFKDEAAFRAELEKRQEDAMENPKVSLYCDGVQKNAPTSGDITVRIAPVIKKDVVAIAAVYEAGKLVCMDMQTTDGERETILAPGSATSDNPACKVLFFDGFDSLSPADFYSVSKMSVYVGENGNDETGNGTRKKPFSTIEKAKSYANSIKSQVDSDVHVTFLPGTYSVENPVAFSVEDSGYGDYNVVYRGEPGKEMPLISGGVKVPGESWVPHENGIYKAYVPQIQEARQMYINGVPAQRSVSRGLYTAAEIYQKEGSSYEEDGFVLYDTLLPEFAKPDELEMVTHINWVTQRVPVENVQRDDYRTVFTMDQPMYDSYISAICGGGIQPIVGSRVYFENALELIDEPGEFYFDEDEQMLYYYPYAEENLETAEVYLPKSNGIFRIEGTETENRVKNLRFSHLDIRHGAWNSVNETGFCSYQADCMLEHDAHQVDAFYRGLIPLAQVQINNADGITVSDCIISNVGSTGIGIHKSVSNSVVERNVICDISGTGVAVGSWKYNAHSDPRTLCDTVTVQNNYITRIGQEYMGCLGVGVYLAKNVFVLHNDIKDVPYTGISVGWCWSPKPIGDYAYGGHTIMGNRIESVCQERRDGGHIYTLGYLADMVVSDNYMITSQDYGGIYLDQGSSCLQIEKNVAENCYQWMFVHTLGGTDVVAHSNYSDADNLGIYNDTEDCQQIEATLVVENAAWTGESAEVVAASGIETHLRDIVPQPVAYPAWRKLLYDYIPRSEPVDEDAYLVEAENYMPGGNGVGYYRPAGEPVIYHQKGGTVIGNFSAGHWCKYTVDVKKAGTYRIGLRAGAGPVSLSKPVQVTVEINDEIALEKVSHSLIPTPWDRLLATILGNVTLQEGVNTIKIANAQGSWTYDNFKLTYVE